MAEFPKYDYSNVALYVAMFREARCSIMESGGYA